jgi:hypothetical protein
MRMHPTQTLPVCRSPTATSSTRTGAARNLITDTGNLDSRISCPRNCPAQVGQSRQLHLSAQIIGYAQVSTNEQDLATHRQLLRGLDAPGPDQCRPRRDRKEQERTGLNEALAAVRADGALVLPKLHRLARPLPDAREHHLGHDGTFPGVPAPNRDDAENLIPIRSKSCSTRSPRP